MSYDIKITDVQLNAIIHALKCLNPAFLTQNEELTYLLPCFEDLASNEKVTPDVLHSFAD